MQHAPFNACIKKLKQNIENCFFKFDDQKLVWVSEVILNGRQKKIDFDGIKIVNKE